MLLLGFVSYFTALIVAIIHGDIKKENRSHQIMYNYFNVIIIYFFFTQTIMKKLNMKFLALPNDNRALELMLSISFFLFLPGSR